MQLINLHLLVTQASHNADFGYVSPLFFPEITRINHTPEFMASQLYRAIHEDWLKEGKYHRLLTRLLNEDLGQITLEVGIAPAKNNRYPALSLSFELFFFQKSEAQWVGFIPVLNLSAVGTTQEELRENAVENIRLEFIRKARLQSVPGMLATQWYNQTRVHSVPQDFHFYTLGELAEIQTQEEKELLPQIARRLMAKEGELFGLEHEHDQLVTAMKNRHRDSVLIAGETGKGKTVLIKDFVANKSQHGLGQVAVWEISAAQLLHKLSEFGQWQEYLGQICQELRKSGDILYLPNFAELFEVGQYSGNQLSMADYLRDYIGRGEITILSECSLAEAAGMELRSPGYLAMMTVIRIEEMLPPAMEKILIRKATRLAEQKSCVIDISAIKETFRLQQWFTPYSGLPGKAIHFLDGVISEKEKGDIRVVEEGDIYARFCEETGMPEFMVNPALPLDYATMLAHFEQNIYGQQESITTVLDLLVSIKTAVIKRGKPLASLLFVGPTGVGKTEMAKVLAQFLFGSRDKMLRFDMSEYTDVQSMLRLTGDLSTGEGLLTAAVRQNPFSVVLFDELEKVNATFYDLLLQILGEGRLTDASGRVADFCSTIIIMTSNIGARSYQTGSIGFMDHSDRKSAAITHFTTAVQAHFRPELFNRLDRVIAFSPLDRSTVRMIIDREMEMILNRDGIKGRHIQLSIEKSVLDFLGEAGYHPSYGARFLQRTLKEHLLIPLSKAINQFDTDQALAVEVVMEQQQPVIRITRHKVEPLFQRMIIDGRDLTGLELADEITHQRRIASRMEHGRYFTRFLSMWDQLERKLEALRKKQLERQFWRNTAQTDRYMKLSELKGKFTDAFTEIQLLEEEGFLLINNIERDPVPLYHRFGTWVADMLELKKSLIETLSPELNTCTVSIFGNKNYLYRLADIYLDFGNSTSFTVVSQAIWFDAKAKDDEEKYRRSKLQESMPDSCTLCGIQMEFKGPMAALYLRAEAGDHVWKDNRVKKHKYIIKTATTAMKKVQIPRDIHRKTFFASHQVRRAYEESKGTIQDTPYALKNSPFGHKGFLFDILEPRFITNLDQYLLD